MSPAGVLRLRAISAVSRDKSVMRSAQDDDFVGGSAKEIQNKSALLEQRPAVFSIGIPHVEQPLRSDSSIMKDQVNREGKLALLLPLVV
jgi:hypothetical protein